MKDDLTPITSRLARRADFCLSRGWDMAISSDELRELKALDLLMFPWNDEIPQRLFGATIKLDDDQAARLERALTLKGRPTRRPLLRRQVGASVTIPTGLYDLYADFSTNLARDETVAHISAFVLAEHAGKPATDTVRALLPRRPRWLPRFLWRRIPTVSAEWTLTAEPMWTYPQSSVMLPHLGPGTSAIDVKLHQAGVQHWRTEGA